MSPKWTALNASDSISQGKGDIVLIDKTTGLQRAIVALGFNSALFLAAQAWLNLP
jgi:hypothetical protein